jgi:DNA invertase Pin-like site-specific DNA recombinase
MIYGYARVSTVGQKNDGNSLEEQSNRLVENGAAKIYVDAFTGTKVDRPEFSKLLQVVRDGDTIMATKLDRISRSASQGIELVDKLLSRGVSVHILNMGVMNNTPTGKLIRNIMFSFAEFERDMIVERTSEGKAIARQREGYHEGRKAIVFDTDLFEQCRKKQKEGVMTVNECCKVLGISRSTWYDRVRNSLLTI